MYLYVLVLGFSIQHEGACAKGQLGVQRLIDCDCSMTDTFWNYWASSINIIANLRIVGQHWTRPGSFRPHSGSTQLDSEVAHWHANARPDSESVGPAGLCATLNLKSTRPGLLWAALDSPRPALGRT